MEGVAESWLSSGHVDAYDKMQSPFGRWDVAPEAGWARFPFKGWVDVPSHFLNTTLHTFFSYSLPFPGVPILTLRLRLSSSLFLADSSFRFFKSLPLYHLPFRTLPSLPHSLPLPFPPSLTPFLKGRGTPTTAWAFKHIGLKVVREACGENGDESLSLSVEHCVQACRRCGRAWEASFTIRIEIRRGKIQSGNTLFDARNDLVYILITKLTI